jgi:hypothetical protein
VIRCWFVHDHRAGFPINKLCELIELPRATYYRFANPTLSSRYLDDAYLALACQQYRSGLDEVPKSTRSGDMKSKRTHRSTLKRFVGCAGAAAMMVVALGVPDASAAPGSESGYVTCSGTDGVIATVYGNGWTEGEAANYFDFASFTTPQALHVGPAAGSGAWSGYSDDINYSWTYGHCG